MTAAARLWLWFALGVCVSGGAVEAQPAVFQFLWLVDDGIEQQLAAGDQAVVPASAAQRVTNIGTDDLSCYCLCRPRFVPECYVDLEADPV